MTIQAVSPIISLQDAEKGTSQTREGIKPARERRAPRVEAENQRQDGPGEGEARSPKLGGNDGQRKNDPKDASPTRTERKGVATRRGEASKGAESKTRVGKTNAPKKDESKKGAARKEEAKMDKPVDFEAEVRRLKAEVERAHETLHQSILRTEVEEARQLREELQKKLKQTSPVIVEAPDAAGRFLCCPVCRKGFTASGLLYDHFAAEHPDSLFVCVPNPVLFRCPVCREQFPATDAFEGHLLKRHKIKPTAAVGSVERNADKSYRDDLEYGEGAGGKNAGCSIM